MALLTFCQLFLTAKFRFHPFAVKLADPSSIWMILAPEISVAGCEYVTRQLPR